MRILSSPDQRYGPPETMTSKTNLALDFLKNPLAGLRLPVE